VHPDDPFLADVVDRTQLSTGPEQLLQVDGQLAHTDPGGV
jgi:hypothetical protein